MKRKVITLIYTILADDEPVAAIKSTGPEASEICREGWFLDELSLLKKDGEPLYRPGVRLRARAATEDEWRAYDKEIKAAGEAEDMLFVYLVRVDRS